MFMSKEVKIETKTFNEFLNDVLANVNMNDSMNQNSLYS